MKGMFSRRTARAHGRAGEVKAWVTKHLDLSDEDLVTVAELTCVEPGCPPIETVVTVHGADGVRRSWHIHQPLSKIDETLVVVSISET
tara:strand:- start:6409 stop:6672 length:264 start_codon:yes stop_codon:yes gene_type:complete